MLQIMWCCTSKLIHYLTFQVTPDDGFGFAAGVGFAAAAKPRRYTNVRLLGQSKFDMFQVAAQTLEIIRDGLDPIPVQVFQPGKYFK